MRARKRQVQQEQKKRRHHRKQHAFIAEQAKSPVFLKKAANKRRIARDKCHDCGGTLLQGGGFHCRLCTEKRLAADYKKRHEQKGCIGIFVPDDPQKPVQVVDIDETPISELIGGTEGSLYHTAQAWERAYLSPVYEAWIDDCMLMNHRLRDNPRAETLMREVFRNVFDVRTPLTGPVVFTGPGRMSLLPEEIQKCLAFVK